MKTHLWLFSVFMLFCGITMAYGGMKPELEAQVADLDVTAYAEYDGGESYYVGDSSGDIYTVNSLGISKIISGGGSSPIDSIVNTVGDDVLGDFCYSQNGGVFTYDINNATKSSLNFPDTGQFLAYDFSGTLYCATATALVYRYKDGWDEINSEQLEGCSVTSFYSTPAGLIIVLDKSGEGFVYKRVDDNWQLLKKTDTIIAGSEASIDSGTVTLENADGSSSSINIAGSTSFSSRQVASGSDSTCDDLVTKQELSVTATFVSLNYDKDKDYVNPDTGEQILPSDAIYRVCIKGAGLDATELFQDGYNGFRYKLEAIDVNGNVIGGYSKEAYPITGVRYIEDGLGKTAALNPRDIVFLWNGPVSESGNDYQLRVTEYVKDLNNNDNIELVAPVPVNLPKKTNWEVPQSYSIEIEYEKLNTELTITANGVCAVPFYVRIKDGNEYLAADAEAYRHLAFAVNDNTVITEKIIGCNPFDPSSKGLAILPAEVVEVDGVVKYGHQPESFREGKKYYAFLGENSPLRNSFAVYFESLYCDDFGDVRVDYNIYDSVVVVGDETIELFSEANYGYESNNTNGRVLRISDLKLSNWEGERDGNACVGYIDYILKEDGLFAIFPQGLNTLELPDRMNMSKMGIGYYIEPIEIIDGLHAKAYGMNDTASYSYALKDRQLYAYLFDEYGRPITVTFTDSAEQVAFNQSKSVKDMWNVDDPDDAALKIRLTNWSNLPVCFYSEKDGELNKGVTRSYKGVFVPPTVPESNCMIEGDETAGGLASNNDFMTSHSAKVTNKEEIEFVVKTIGITQKASDEEPSFASKLTFRKLSVTGFGFDTSIEVPAILKTIDDLDDLYLPLNQLYVLNRALAKTRLLYWGVHFMPAKMSCNMHAQGIYLGAVPKREYEWTFKQNSGGSTSTKTIHFLFDKCEKAIFSADENANCENAVSSLNPYQSKHEYYKFQALEDTADEYSKHYTYDDLPEVDNGAWLKYERVIQPKLIYPVIDLDGRARGGVIK